MKVDFRQGGIATHIGWSVRVMPHEGGHSSGWHLMTTVLSLE